MKIIVYVVLIVMHFLSYTLTAEHLSDKKIQLNIRNQEQEKMKLLLVVLNPNDRLLKIAETIHIDLSCAQQKLSGFAVEIQHLSAIPSKKNMKHFFAQGFNIVILLSETNNGAFEWRLYDSLQAIMQKGKRIPLQSTVEATAHTIADQIWKLLTGQESIFLTKIAYCKVVQKDKHTLKDIYIQGPLSNNATCFIKGGKLLAPRWNKDQWHPLILYSEVTPANIRLMSANIEGTRKIISNFDGLTMLASFSPDGRKVVYCASHKGTCQLYYYYVDSGAKKGVTKRLTYNKGNNTSPNLCANGDVIFCSDYETKSPQLYCLTPVTGEIKRLTQGGYCASPHYSDLKNSIVYSKLVDNYMQIFIYDIGKNEHIQLTFDKSNKDECCWSPCGNYLAFALKEEKTSRIAILNIMTKERFFLTSVQEKCSYPAWSPWYCDIGIFG